MIDLNDCLEDLNSMGEISLFSGVKLLPQKIFKDARGVLQFGETPSGLPFDAKRYFLISDVPEGSVRGAHAHKDCEQFLICVKGSVSCEIRKDGNIETVKLNSSEAGLYFPKMTWGIQFEYSSDAVLLVFASHSYDANDYIHGYDEFVELERN